jgi:hypothetical protein
MARLMAREAHANLLGDFAIYNPGILALRGLHVMSRREPLGIHGEILDYAVSILMLKPEIWADVLERARCISWLDDIVVDVADKLKYD